MNYSYAYIALMRNARHKTKVQIQLHTVMFESNLELKGFSSLNKFILKDK